MNEAIGAAVYLVLALTIAVGIWAVFRTGRPVRKAGATARTQAHPAPIAKVSENAWRPHPRAEHRHAVPPAVPQEHALPWVIPTALTPEATYGDSKKATMSIEELCERLVAIESQLKRIGGKAVR
jgi:predicted membrane-bound mannosyltransferase